MTTVVEAQNKPDEQGQLTARDSTFVHVTVWADSSSYDIELHVHSPIVELLPDLIDELTANLDRDSKPSKWLRATGVQWTLAKGATGTLLDSSASLADAKVEFGDTLYLRRRRRTEGPPMWRDDIAQGAAEVSKQEFSLLSEQDTRRLAVCAFPTLALGLSILASVVVGPVPQSRWVSLGILGFITLTAAAVAAVLYRQYAAPEQRGEKYGDVAAGLVVTTYIAAAGAGVLAVPRGLGTWHLAVVGAVLLGVSIALAALTENRPASLHMGIGATGAVLTFVGVLHLVLPVSGQAVAAQVMWLAVFTLLIAPSLGRNKSGIRLTYVAATGEPLVRDDDATVVAVSRRSTESQAIEDIVNQQQRVILSFQSQMGILIAMSALLPIGAAFAGAQTRQYEWHLFAAVLGISATAFAVGRGVVVRALSLPGMIAGPVTWCAYLIGRALSDTPIPVPVLAAGVAILIVVVVVTALGAIQRKKLRSPITKKALEQAAKIGALAALPLIGFICEIWPLLRNH